ncbi:MAG: molybdopterin-dependent oxidoreductase, partial [Caulobacteraceae bacterium]
MASRHRQAKIQPYEGPAGGYGSVKSVAEILLKEGIPIEGAELITHQNKPDGYMCVSCAWGKPARPHPLEVCENGVKAAAWETTRHRAGDAFFARHSLGELEGWGDHELERAGRLTTPMRWEAGSDKYVPVEWAEAFGEIGRELRALGGDPDQAVFYTSGRASLEASYMYQLMARIYGTNNLPDSS